MPSTLPDGEPVPDDGALPDGVRVGPAGLGFYVHVPFCAVRCGYCDFNTYTAEELGPGVARSDYAATAVEEVRLARRVLGELDAPVDTVFVGGGTPTLLDADDLGRVLAAIEAEFGLADGVEVTTEANPDSVTPEGLRRLREHGFTRISFGMQSEVGHVLRVLDRTHDPRRVPEAVGWARDVGFEQVSLDLIYGTPGESLADWERSVRAALDCAPDHLSAYALIVEDGTALARRVRRGEIPAPEDDDLADKYELVDELLGRAGLEWYEVSNWARDETAHCRHNVRYWTGADWWGVGPGAHSHVDGVRWWNRKHPTAYTERLRAGLSPALAREVLTPADRRVERMLLEVRLRSGVPLDLLDDAGRAVLPDLQQRGLVRVGADRLVLTSAGRLLADAVVRDLLG